MQRMQRPCLPPCVLRCLDGKVKQQDDRWELLQDLHFVVEDSAGDPRHRLVAVAVDSYLLGETFVGLLDVFLPVPLLSLRLVYHVHALLTRLPLVPLLVSPNALLVGNVLVRVVGTCLPHVGNLPPLSALVDEDYSEDHLEQHPSKQSRMQESQHPPPTFLLRCLVVSPMTISSLSIPLVCPAILRSLMKSNITPLACPVTFQSLSKVIASHLAMLPTVTMSVT